MVNFSFLTFFLAPLGLVKMLRNSQVLERPTCLIFEEDTN